MHVRSFTSATDGAGSLIYALFKYQMRMSSLFQERAAWAFSQFLLAALDPLSSPVQICVEVTRNCFSLFHTVPVKRQLHLQVWISVFEIHFLIPVWFGRRICSFALTVAVHLGNIFMHEWHVPCGKAAGRKIMLACKPNVGQNLKAAHYWKNHTVLKTTELQKCANSHYLLTLMPSCHPHGLLS